MRFLNKLVSKLTQQKKEIKNDKIINAETIKVLATYETKLHGFKAGKRQELLKSMGKNEQLKVKPILTNGKLRLSINLGGGTIGIIPSKIINELEKKYSSNFEVIITKYKISKNTEGLYECFVSVQINSES